MLLTPLVRVTCFVCCLLHLVAGSKLIFLLVDGFRWDYFNIPGLRLRGFPRMFTEGVKVEYMVPDFPTNSLPNYKTLETGLHVENHGMVGNFMWDEQTDKEFELGETENSFDINWWNKAESFFITAEKQGKKTSLFHVRACHLDYDGVKASTCRLYSGPPSFDDINRAMDDTVNQLKNGSTEIAYIYHEMVDKMGHLHGPNSRQVVEAIQEVDGQLDQLQDKLRDAGLDDKVDIIVVSDHGMTTLDLQHMINISQVLDLRDIAQITESWSQAYIWPKDGKTDKVYGDLKDFHPHLNVYRRQELADRWFFKNHRLVPPVLVQADPGWFLVHPLTAEKYEKNTADTLLLGNHGFDNNEIDMRAIFVAKGPHFKKGYLARPFSNVNVYQVICHSTGMKPRPHNGTWSLVEDMFIIQEPRHEDL